MPAIRIDQQDLIEKVRQSSEDHPQRPDFMLWLGAGASVECGVPSASQLVLEILRTRYDRQRPTPTKLAATMSDEEIYEWAIDRGWYNPKSRKKSIFAQVIERAYQTPDDQKRFLRQRLEKAEPSRGYELLGVMLQRKIFDTIVTTNFDHLVRKGSDPLLNPPLEEVNSAEQLQLLNPHPGNPCLLRLHGDFWHSNPAVTPHDLESISESYAHLKRLLRHYGLIVIGYGAQDFTIRQKLFDGLWDDPAVLRKGLYWCYQRGGPALSPNVKSVLRSAPSGRAFIVEIEGFEDLMSGLANAFKLAVPLDEYLEQLRVSWEFESLLTDLVEATGSAVSALAIQELRHEGLRQLNRLLHADRAVCVLCGSISDEWEVSIVPNEPLLRLDNRPVTESLTELHGQSRDYQRISAKELSVENVFYEVLEGSGQIESFPVWRGEQLIGLVSFASRGQPIHDQQLRLIRAAVRLLVQL